MIDKQKTYFCKKCPFESKRFGPMKSHSRSTDHPYGWKLVGPIVFSDKEIKKIRKRNKIIPDKWRSKRPRTIPLVIPITTHALFKQRCKELKRHMWELADEVLMEYLNK